MVIQPTEVSQPAEEAVIQSTEVSQVTKEVTLQTIVVDDTEGDEEYYDPDTLEV